MQDPEDTVTIDIFGDKPEKKRGGVIIMADITGAIKATKEATKACMIRNKVLDSLDHIDNEPHHINALYAHCERASKVISGLTHEGLARQLCKQINDSFVRNSIRINKKASGATLAKRK